MFKNLFIYLLAVFIAPAWVQAQLDPTSGCSYSYTLSPGSLGITPKDFAGEFSFICPYPTFNYIATGSYTGTGPCTAASSTSSISGQEVYAIAAQVNVFFSPTDTNWQYLNYYQASSPEMTMTSIAGGPVSVVYLPYNTIAVASSGQPFVVSFFSAGTPCATSTPIPSGPSNTPTPTNTDTFTPTPTGSTPTPTNTPTFTETWTPTNASSNTSTPSVTNTPVPASLTPTSVVGPNIRVLFPNPVAGNSVQMIPPLTSVSNVKVQIYSTAYRLVEMQTFNQVQVGTILSLSLLSNAGRILSNGLYYVVVTTDEGRFIQKLLVLR